MNASSSCEWRKAFKTIHGRSPRKGADFELISVNKVGRNQSHNIAGKAPAKYKRFVKLKRSSDDCTNLVPCKKKCDSPPAEVKVEDITKPLTGECDRLMLPNSDVFHHQEKLSENSSSSPSKKIQGKVIIESPRKIPLLRRTNANLFVDHLLAEDEQEPDIDEEQNVELMQEEWKDELTGCADQQSSSQNVNSVNSLKRLKSEASNNNGKKRQRNKSSLTSERNFVRLNIRRKIFAKKYSNAQKKRKFYRNKKFR